MKQIVMTTTMVTIILAQTAFAGQEVNAVTYSPHAAKSDCLMNMGPTGARAWMRGYHFVVVEIAFGSPAADALQPADVVIAADGVKFSADNNPRVTLGNAIGDAEKTGDPLVLTVLRKGRKTKVRIPLPQTGTYAGNWATGSPKSQLILDKACQLLLNDQMPNGQVITDGNIGTTHGGLLMLANPNPKFLDGARRAAYEVAEQEYGFASVCNNWPMSYGGILLAEYFLATGDDTVLPRLKDIVDLMSRGQMRCGSWGHTSPSGAYGALNQVGVICAITLTLANECGIDVPQDTLDKTHRFFGRFAEIGAVPYGDHHPYTSEYDSNGRSASAAVLMHLAGMPVESQAFSTSVAMSYNEREKGHTGGFFSMTWGPLGAALSGTDKLQTFMDNQEWYYNLARTWQGGLRLLPYHEALTRFDSSTYTDNDVFTSGGMGLAFALPYKRLRILGAPESVFSPATKLTGRLAKVRDHWMKREWTECNAILDNMSPDKAQKAHYEQFVSARDYRSQGTDALMLELESNLDNAAAYRAINQYEALKKALGNEPDDRFEAMDKRMEGAARAVESGQRMFDAYRELRGLEVMSWVPYGPRAHDLLKGLGSLRVPVWEPLSAVSEITPQPWRTLHADKDQDEPAGWTSISFNDSDWKTSEGIAGPVGGSRPFARRVFTVDDPEGDAVRVRLRTVRSANTRVYLNGELIVNAVRGQRGGYAVIPLDKSALGLIKKGDNVLAVSSTSQATGGNQLDVGLEICRALYNTAATTLITADGLVVNGGKDVDNTLHVRDRTTQLRNADQEACNEKETSELVDMLSSSVAVLRNMAERALVTKGLEGISAVGTVLDHEDWKVRSSACNVITGAASKYRSAGTDEMKLIHAQIPKLMNLLNDEHTWVQVRAMVALRAIGGPASKCLPRLMKLVSDDDEWVRTEALSAIEQLAPDEATKLDAALASLRITNSAFRNTRMAYRILKSYPRDNDARMEALAVTLRNPPQGGGGRTLLKPLLDYAVSLDPEGKIMIPILLEAARDKELRYSRQQANPRARIIELLAAYGDKAKDRAIPVLQEVLASEDRHDVAQHAKAREALKAFGVEVEEEEE